MVAKRAVEKVSPRRNRHVLTDALRGTEPKSKTNAFTLDLLQRAMRSLESIYDKEIANNGPTSCQYAVLAAVAAGDRLSQTDIGEATGIDRSTLAEVVRRLVKRGHLNRRRTRADARRYEITLTPTGQAMLKTGTNAAERTEQHIAGLLTADESARLAALLRRVGENPRN